jgi:GTP-binding protein
MLIDDITIHVKSGKGGDGVVAFNKNLMTLGPTGGSGGRGGNVYFEASWI